MIPARDASELDWYFCDGYEARSHEFGDGAGAAAAGGGSSFGDQLERAAVLYRDSAGDVVPPSGRMAEVLVELPSGKYTRRLQLWPTALAKPALVVPSGFLPSPGLVVDATDEQMLAAGERREKRLTRREAIEARLGRLDGDAYEAVRLLYGPRGAQWLQTPRGRVWSLVPVTDVGRKHRPATSEGLWLADLDLCTGRQWLTDLAVGKQWASQDAVASERARRSAVARDAQRWLDAALNQAERRERSAAQAWAATAPRRTPVTITKSEDS